LSQKEQLERQLQEETRVLRDSSLANLTQQQNQQLDPHAEEEIRRLREEVDILRAELQRAEGELDDRICWAPPPELQHWLQLTYEVEQRAYNKKRLQAEKQLEQAKDAVSAFSKLNSAAFLCCRSALLISLIFFFPFDL
jgi:stromal interaction molecule 1